MSSARNPINRQQQANSPLQTQSNHASQREDSENSPSQNRDMTLSARFGVVLVGGFDLVLDLSDGLSVDTDRSVLIVGFGAAASGTGKADLASTTFGMPTAFELGDASSKYSLGTEVEVAAVFGRSINANFGNKGGGLKISPVAGVGFTVIAPAARLSFSTLGEHWMRGIQMSTECSICLKNY